MARIVKTNEVTQTAEREAPSVGIPPMTTGGNTGAITRVISQRRSNRHHWRIFEMICMLILDAALLDASLQLALNLRSGFLQSADWFIDFRHNIMGMDPVRSTSSNIGFGENAMAVEICIVLGALLIFAINRLYFIRLTGTWFRQAWTVIRASTLGLVVLIAYYFVYQPPSSSRILIPILWVCAIVLLCLGRLVVSGVMGILYRLGLGETRLLVVGSGRLGKMVMQHIVANPNLGYYIVGFLHDMVEQPSDFGRFKMLGTLDDLGSVIRNSQIDEVIIALPSDMHQHVMRSVKLCERLGASFKLIPDIYELNLSRIDMEAIEGIPLIGIKQESLNTVQRLITRAVDIVGSLAILLLGSPLWLLLALCIRLTSQGPVIYTQKRVGLDGRLFDIYKFRSMYKNADEMRARLMAQNEAQGPLFKMKDDPRVTPIGKFIRRTSLDEIPQMFSIIRGDMSLVGPRPPLPSEVAQYEEWQKGRLAIKPGMTGLWQVRGRSNLTFDEGVLMDLYYIENWSLQLYFQILFRTLPAVLFSRGAY